MRGLKYVIVVACLFSSFSAKSEYCWMVGCKDQEGFIFTHIVKDGKKESVFRNHRFPSEGENATLAAFVTMSTSPPTKPEEGPYNLGPGFVVKILKYVGKEREIAHIKIVSDDLK